MKNQILIVLSLLSINFMSFSMKRAYPFELASSVEKEEVESKVPRLTTLAAKTFNKQLYSGQAYHGDVTEDKSKVSRLTKLAAKAAIKQIYTKCDGNKSEIEKFIRLKFSTVRCSWEDYFDSVNMQNKEIFKRNILHALNNEAELKNIKPISAPELGVELAKQYFYIYGNVNVNYQERHSQFLDLGVNYGFTIQELIDNDKIPNVILQEIEGADEEGYDHPLLDLRCLKINCLEGISNLPDIDTVKCLELSHNQISKLDNNIFTSLSELSMLFLEHNRINYIAPNTFYALNNFHSLYLAFNEISELDTATFNELDLICLDLSHNNLSRIEDSVFSGLFNLESLLLDHNQIQELNANLFEDLGEIRCLNLNNNQIKLICDNTFANLRRIFELDLSHNHLNELSENKLRGLENIRHLYLRNNKITELNIDDLPRFVFGTIVFIEDNPLTKNTMRLMVDYMRSSTATTLFPASWLLNQLAQL